MPQKDFHLFRCKMPDPVDLLSLKKPVGDVVSDGSVRQSCELRNLIPFRNGNKLVVPLL